MYIKWETTMEINSLYSPYSTINTTKYGNEQKIEHSTPSTTTNDTVSISIEARERAANSSPTHSTSSSETMNTLKYGDLNTYENMSFMEKVNQSVQDRRAGIDREEIEEINQKMEDIINDKTIPADQKAEMLEQLNKEKQNLFEKAAEITAEHARDEGLQPDKENI